MKPSVMTRDEMQDCVEDYVAGRLTTPQREAFESSLASYPDVEETVRQHRVVHSVMDAGAVRSHLDRHARDLSIRVHERLRTAVPGKRTPLLRWSPVLVTAALAFLLLLPNDAPDPAVPDFDQELELALRGVSDDSLVVYADRDADYAVHESSYGQMSAMTSDLSLLQDAAEEIAAAAMPQSQVPRDHVVQESLELLIHSELQDVESVMKELEDVAS
ncbi:MAG: hypothetical protein ACKOBV_00780 [Candidatus Kapaibacterium sp.]